MTIGIWKNDRYNFFMLVLSRVVITCLFVLAIGNYSVWGTAFFDPKTRANISYSGDWQNVPIQNAAPLIKLKHNSLNASISLSVHNFSSIVEITDFRNHYQKAQFSGWELLSERKGTPFENKTAQVDASWNCINIRKNRPQFPTGELSVQTYFLVAGRKGFILSLTTDLKTWKQIQPQYRSILSSFWVGEGNRPIVSKPIPEADGWETPGSSVQNRNFIRNIVPANGSKTVFWKFSVPKSLGANPIFTQPLLLPNAVIVGYGTILSAFSPYDGQIKWSQNLKSPILGNPIVSGKVATIISTGTANVLTALSVDTGSILFRKKLSTDAPVQLSVLGDTIILATENGILALDKNSGKDKWSSTTPVSLSLPIVGTSGVFVVLDNNTGDLIGIQLDSGKELWRKTLADPILIPPNIIQNTLVVTASDPNRSTLFYGFNVQNGTFLWSRRLPPNLNLISELSADTAHFFVPVQQTADPLLSDNPQVLSDDGDLAAQFKILCYDIKTGNKTWEYQMPSTQLLLPVRGVVGPNTVYYLATSIDKSSAEIVNLVGLDIINPKPQIYPMIPFGGYGQPKGFVAFQMLAHQIILQYQDPVSGLLLLQ